MKRIDLRRVFVTTGLLALVVLYAILWLRMISSPQERTGSDFISAYTAGRVATRWGAAEVYNLDYQRQVQAEVLGFPLAPGQVLMFNHPPYLVPLLALVMEGNYSASLVRYTLVMAVLYAGALFMLWRLLRQAGWERALTGLALAGIATFYPLFVSLLNTQDTALLVLGGVLLLAGLLEGRDWLAALGLALMTVRPHIALLLALPFLFRRQKVFLWFCAAALVLGLASLGAVGLIGVQAYLRLLLTAAGGQFYGMHENAMVNLVGLLWRIAPGLNVNVIHWIGWIAYGITLVGLCLLWFRSREVGTRQVALAIPLVLFVAPHLHYHDLALLIIPLTAALLLLVQRGFLRARAASIAPLAFSLLLLFSNLITWLKYNFPYLVMLSIVLAAWFPGALFWEQKNLTMKEHEG